MLRADSRALKGQKVADEARALLTAPSVYGQPCADLIATLYQAGQFNTEDLYAQLRLSGEYNATGQARRIVALLDGPERKPCKRLICRPWPSPRAWARARSNTRSTSSRWAAWPRPASSWRRWR
jgi:hypothetical protein